MENGWYVPENSKAAGRSMLCFHHVGAAQSPLLKAFVTVFLLNCIPP